MNICEEVKNTRTIGISGHLRPDGDCVGAVMGLYLYLKKACPMAEVQVLLEKPADKIGRASCRERVWQLV